MEGRGGVLTPGFRFYPTEEELVSFYLKHKIEGNSSRTQKIDRVIPQLHVYDFNPWDLPQYAGEPNHEDPEQWFFFIPRQEKEARGGRPCRLTSSGYWKATGSPTVVYSSGNRGIGMKRTMVFYSGRAPTGKKTQWKMHEYKAFKEETASKPSPNPEMMQELSLCRVYIKSHCLRAFDRRPSGVTTSESQHVQQTLHNHNDHQATTSSHMNRHSPDPSHNSSQDQQTSMQIENNQPLAWNWEEHLDWF